MVVQFANLKQYMTALRGLMQHRVAIQQDTINLTMTLLGRY